MWSLVHFQFTTTICESSTFVSLTKCETKHYHSIHTIPKHSTMKKEKQHTSIVVYLIVQTFLSHKKCFSFLKL